MPETYRYIDPDSVYAWAGKPRMVEISKGGKPFFPTSHFNSAFRYIDSLLAEYRSISAHEQTALTQKLAEILTALIAELLVPVS